jgi:hypothetical protein
LITALVARWSRAMSHDTPLRLTKAQRPAPPRKQRTATAHQVRRGRAPHTGHIEDDEVLERYEGWAQLCGCSSRWRFASQEG